MENNDIPPTPPPATDSPKFPVWLCRRLGQKLKAARLAQKTSAMAVAKRPRATVSDQTLLNNEKGRKNGGLATYTRHAQALDLNILDLLLEIRQELPPPP